MFCQNSKFRTPGKKLFRTSTMDDESIRQQSRVSIPGMETVVATVSGYHGSERFKLIKLISYAGGSYVGSMNQSTTHLICWKFEGPKYELAKKFKMKIVNHRWIEECLKQGRRVSEKLYTLHCGKEMGPLLMDTPPVANNVSNSLGYQSSAGNGSAKHVINIDCEEDDCAVSTDSSFLKENTFPEIRRKSSRLKRKSAERSTRHYHSSSARHHFDEPTLFPDSDNEHEEWDSPSIRRQRQKKSSCGEPSRKGRRLVRKNVISNVLESEEDCLLGQVHHWQDDITTPSNWQDDITTSSGGNPGTIGNYHREDVEEIKDSNVLSSALDQSVTPKDSNESSLGTRLAKSVDLLEGASTSLVNNTSLDQSSTPKDSGEMEPLTRLAKPTSDLSCVICWTDFSSSRGVLPCGHRFCFPCIQNWADHMSSSRKISTCPLCKASFEIITKVDDAVSSDQKIYSQTIPHDPSVNIYVIPSCEPSNLRTPLSTSPVCNRCCSREPEELLIRCHLCQTRCIHSYCLDPYMVPWTCTHCKDFRLYHH